MLHQLCIRMLQELGHPGVLKVVRASVYDLATIASTTLKPPSPTTAANDSCIITTAARSWTAMNDAPYFAVIQVTACVVQVYIPRDLKYRAPTGTGGRRIMHAHAWNLVPVRLSTIFRIAISIPSRVRAPQIRAPVSLTIPRHEPCTVLSVTLASPASAFSVPRALHQRSAC